MARRGPRTVRSHRSSRSPCSAWRPWRLVVWRSRFGRAARQLRKRRSRLRRYHAWSRGRRHLSVPRSQACCRRRASILRSHARGRASTPRWLMATQWRVRSLMPVCCGATTKSWKRSPRRLASLGARRRKSAATSRSIRWCHRRPRRPTRSASRRPRPPRRVNPPRVNQRRVNPRRVLQQSSPPRKSRLFHGSRRRKSPRPPRAPSPDYSRTATAPADSDAFAAFSLRGHCGVRRVRLDPLRCEVRESASLSTGSPRGL